MEFKKKHKKEIIRGEEVISEKFIFTSYRIEARHARSVVLIQKI